MIIDKRPLADLIRPKNLEEIIGQEHLFGDSGALSLIALSKNIPSMILWGPTGVGKTTIAKALAQVSNANFVVLSAINSGAAEIRKVIENANSKTLLQSGKTILMIDEIHHFNKTQQDWVKLHI